MHAFEDLKLRSDGQSMPSGEFSLPTGVRYSVSAYDMAPHGVASMYKAAGVIVCAGGFLAVRIVQRLGTLQLDGFDAGIGRGPLKLVAVA